MRRTCSAAFGARHPASPAAKPPLSWPMGGCNAPENGVKRVSGGLNVGPRKSTTRALSGSAFCQRMILLDMGKEVDEVGEEC